MLDFLSLKQEGFGLDISETSFKIAKLKKKRGKFSLVSFGEESIPKGIIEEGEIKDEDALAKIIKDGFKKIRGEKIQTKYTVCSLPEKKSYLKVIKLPKMKEEELKGAVGFEAENYIPLPLEEVYLDFQVIQPLLNHKDHLDVLVVATPKKIVDSYVSSIKKAGFLPKVLEIESFALARALIKDEITHFPVLIIDVGATKTSFLIFSGTSLVFTSSIPISSHNFTEAISKTLKISLEKAEEFKRKYGIKITQKIILKEKTGDTELEKEVIEDKTIFEALIPVLTDLTEQIKIHLDYYQSHFDSEYLPSNFQGVKQILLCGGGTNLKGLNNFLLGKLKIKTEVCDPWVNISKGKPEMSSEQSLIFATALGLALRGIKND